MEVQLTQFVDGIKKAVENIQHAMAELQQNRKVLLQILQTRRMAIIATMGPRAAGTIPKSLKWVP